MDNFPSPLLILIKLVAGATMTRSPAHNTYIMCKSQLSDTYKHRLLKKKNWKKKSRKQKSGSETSTLIMADESLFLRKSPRYNKTHQGTTRHNEDIAFERSSLFTSPTRERNTFFCSSSQSRFELASTTSPSSYQPRSYPYQSNLTFPKYQRRVFDYLEDEMPPWSMANPPRRRQLLPSRTVLAESERNPKVNESSSETMHERTGNIA